MNFGDHLGTSVRLSGAVFLWRCFSVALFFCGSVFLWLCVYRSSAFDPETA